MSEKIRVMLVEDHPEYREVVELALEKEKSCQLWAEFGTAERAIQHLHDHQNDEVPDVILLDLNLPGLDGLQALPLILDILPSVKIIVLTQSDREDDVLQALTQGASGYLLKSSTVRQLIDGIRSVVKGGASLDARIAHVVLTSLRSKNQTEAQEHSITDRELEVLTLLAEGFSKKMIADELSISTTTVVTHVTNIYAKLDAQNGPAAIAKAFRSGLLKLD